MSKDFVFFRRIFAFSIDSIFLVIIGAILCNLFFMQISSLGNWASFIGFIFFVLYYGLQNSILCHGQTIGKKLLKIKITDLNGEYISVKKSLVRAILLTPIMIFNQLISPIGTLGIAFSILISIIFFIYFILFIFNTPSRRTLHDIIVKTVCVKSDTQKFNIIENKKKVNIIIISACLLATVVVSLIMIFMSKIFNTNIMQLNSFNNKLLKNKNISITGVTFNKNYDNSTKMKTFSVNYLITVRNININDKNLCQYNQLIFVNELIKNNKIDKNINNLRITILRNANVGLFSSNRTYSTSGTLEQWESSIKTYNVK